MKALDLTLLHTNQRGTGSAQYPPSMMLGLLIYCYATGSFASRRIETLTYENLAQLLQKADDADYNLKRLFNLGWKADAADGALRGVVVAHGRVDVGVVDEELDQMSN